MWKWKSVLVLSLAAVLTAGLCGSIPAVAGESASTITIVDSAGRVVELPYPLERVVVINPPVAEVMLALGVADSVVGTTGSVAKKLELGVFSDTLQVARSAHGEPDLEKIIELSPQAVITYGTHPAIDIQQLADALAPAGIAVVGIDAYKLDTLYRDILTLGMLFEKLPDAAELIVFFQNALEAVEEKVGQVAGEGPRVYAEQHGDNAYGPGSEWDEIIGMAGGINIFADAPMPYFEADPEVVLERNPQVVLKDTRRTPPMGYGVTDPEPIKAYIDELVARPGWDALDAVQDGKVYVISTSIGSGPRKIFMVPYLAKIFHPELEIDPEALLSTYHETFLGVEHWGIFVYPTP